MTREQSITLRSRLILAVAIGLIAWGIAANIGEVAQDVAYCLGL